MGCPAQTFTGMTRDKFTSLAAQARADGVLISGDRGLVSAHGGTFAWDFEESDSTLTITCLQNPKIGPFHISCDAVYSKIGAWVNPPVPAA